jgi:hypothetical protein
LVFVVAAIKAWPVIEMSRKSTFVWKFSEMQAVKITYFVAATVGMVSFDTTGNL